LHFRRWLQGCGQQKREFERWPIHLTVRIVASEITGAHFGGARMILADLSAFGAGGWVQGGLGELRRGLHVRVDFLNAVYEAKVVWSQPEGDRTHLGFQFLAQVS
ncbi:MAG: PilZ domain-containing protein, partial [Bdellovibrionaceae bacterium]|nr:PilZ domain-containing protein [Pseudobdellovibrionaceae bacterium]